MIDRVAEHTKREEEISKIFSWLGINQPPSYLSNFNSIIVHKCKPYLAKVDKNDKTFRIMENGKPVGRELDLYNNIYEGDSGYKIYELSDFNLGMIASSFTKEELWER